MKIGFIGAGNMAGAIIRGMVGGGFRGSDILIYDTDSAKMVALFEECGVSILLLRRGGGGIGGCRGAGGQAPGVPRGAA